MITELTDEPELPGVADPSIRQREELAPVLDVCRCIMLVEPLAAEFNELTTLNGTQRLVALAELVGKAAETNEGVRALVRNKDVMRILRSHATLRKTGEIVATAALPTALAEPAQRGAMT